MELSLIIAVLPKALQVAQTALEFSTHPLICMTLHMPLTPLASQSTPLSLYLGNGSTITAYYIFSLYRSSGFIVLIFMDNIMIVCSPFAGGNSYLHIHKLIY